MMADEIPPVVVETPGAVAAVELPATEVAAPVAEFVPHTDTPTLLQETVAPGVKPAESVAAEPKAPDAAAAEVKAEEKPAVEVAAEPVAEPVVAPVVAERVTYGEFKIPEGLKVEPAQLGAFTEVLGKHGVPQETAQSLLDMHMAAIQGYADTVSKQQHSAFADVRREWVKQAQADPEIGGAGHLTAMGAIARMRDLAISDSPKGSPKYIADAAAFNEFLTVTGAGDNPAFLKMMHNFARHFDEPALPPANIKPAPGVNGTPARGLRSLYTNTARQ